MDRQGPMWNDLRSTFSGRCVPRPGTPRRRDVKLRFGGIIALVLGSVAVPVVALRQDRLPNELGRIPILEYHKVDRPEARWTRTPENFRADLERFWKNGYRLI